MSKKKWKGLCEEGKHGLDFEGQNCDRCLRDRFPELASGLNLQFKDIPQFPRAHYEIDVEWPYIEAWIAGQEAYGLNLEPDFQREHVWTKAQQTAYIEHCLQGGEVGRVIVFNCDNWDVPSKSGVFEIVDGKQRLQAVRAFLRDEVPVFGQNVYSKMGRVRFLCANFKLRICNLKNRADVLRLYLKINAGGTPHTKQEIERVKKLLAKEEKAVKDGV